MNSNTLWYELTWHNFIEVIAIVVATLIVHPVSSFIKSTYNVVAQKIAYSSKKRDLKRVKRLLDHYARIWKVRKLMLENPYAASLITSSENLRIITDGLLALFLIGASEFAYLPLGFVLFGIIGIQYVKILDDRKDTLYFDNFRNEIQSLIDKLRPTADDNAQITQWWYAYFDEKAPFAQSTTSVLPSQNA